MTDISTKLLAALGSLALAFTLGVGTGEHLAHNASAAQALTAANHQAAALEKARAVGDAIVAQVVTEAQAIQTNRLTVEKRIADAPLLAAAPACIARGPDLHPPVHADAAAGPAAPAAADGAAPPDAAAEFSGGDDAVLSLAAVSLWNSALAGVDVPAGACSPADPASPACAAGAEVTLADAWLNHAANAAGCAEDRARHQHLIDYLRRTR